MKLVFYEDLRNPREAEATRLVVMDRRGNPLLAALELSPDAVVIETAEPGKEAEFQAFLRALGVDRTVVVTDAPIRPLPEV